MKYVSIFSAVILSLVTLAAARAADPSPTPTSGQTRKSPFDPIAFLVGGVWRGELPPGPNDTPISIELRAEWLPNHQGIGFNGTLKTLYCFPMITLPPEKPSMFNRC